MATPPTSRVLRIPRLPSDGDAFVLLQATHVGPFELDVTLVATEGASPYTGALTQNEHQHLRAKNYYGREEEWSAILSFVLRGRRARIRDFNPHELEVVASVNGASRITITIRKNIAGITQRLGSISLRRDDAKEIELFDWTGQAALAAATADEYVSSLESVVDTQKTTIAELQQQLDDFIRAKEQHEKVMMEKFQLLLNAKKFRIREQQRYIDQLKGGTTNVGQWLQGVPVEDPLAPARRRQPGPSRERKRRASSNDSSSSSSSINSAGPPDDVEAKQDDRPQADDGNETESDRSWTMQTPPVPSGQETAAAQGKRIDEEEEEDAFGAAPRVSPPSKTKEKLSKEPRRVTMPPPRRELPFARKDDRPGEAQDSGGGGGGGRSGGTAMEDDEFPLENLIDDEL